MTLVLKWSAIFLSVLIACLILCFTPLQPALAVREHLVCPLNCDHERTLKLTQPYMQGQDVRRLQKELQQLGFYHGPANGSYDPLTAQSVKDFQQSVQFTVNGIVTSAVWHQLALNIEKPVVKSTDLPPPIGELCIIVDTINRKLLVFSDGALYKSFYVAVGAPESPSPVGSWKIINKGIDIGPQFGSRWLGLNVPWGTYGIHGTNNPYSIGNYASHGCIRMFNTNVEELFGWIPEGTPVYVVGNPFGVPGTAHLDLKEGDLGADVYEVQRSLKRLGWYQGRLDGAFGWSFAQAVKKFRTAHGLSSEFIVDKAMYQILGL